MFACEGVGLLVAAALMSVVDALDAAAVILVAVAAVVVVSAGAIVLIDETVVPPGQKLHVR